MEHLEHRHFINAQNRFTLQSNGWYSQLNNTPHFYKWCSCNWNSTVACLMPLYRGYTSLPIHFTGICIGSCVYSQLETLPQINGKNRDEFLKS